MVHEFWKCRLNFGVSFLTVSSVMRVVTILNVVVFSSVASIFSASHVISSKFLHEI